MRLTRKSLCLPAICLLVVSFAKAQEFPFSKAAIDDPAALSKTITALAETVMAAYKDEDQDRSLNNLFRLQIVSGKYAEALTDMSE